MTSDDTPGALDRTESSSQQVQQPARASTDSAHRNCIGLNGFAVVGAASPGLRDRSICSSAGTEVLAFEPERRMTDDPVASAYDRDMRLPALPRDPGTSTSKRSAGWPPTTSARPICSARRRFGAYLLHLRDERGVARGTFKTNHGGIRFLYSDDASTAIGRCSQKKRSRAEAASGCRSSSPMPRSAPSWPRYESDPQAVLCILMYACGLRISEAADAESAPSTAPMECSASSAKATRSAACRCHEPMLAKLRRLWLTHRNPRWLSPDRSGTGPISKNALWRTFRLAARARRHQASQSIPTDCATAMQHGCSNSGIEARVVQILLGHVNIATDRHLPRT